MIERIKIPRRLLDDARWLDNAVYRRKKERFGDKFITGDEKGADFFGFFLEFAACHYFGKPMPKLLDGDQLDEYDLKLNGKLIDVKHSKECLVNKEQFDRKKDIDIYLFGSSEFISYENGLVFAKFYGWIERDKVPEKSLLMEFNNGSRAYSVNKRALKPIEKLKEGEDGQGRE